MTPSIFQPFGRLFPTADALTHPVRTESVQSLRGAVEGAALGLSPSGRAEATFRSFKKVLGGMEGNEEGVRWENGGENGGNREGKEINEEFQVGIGDRGGRNGGEVGGSGGNGVTQVVNRSGGFEGGWSTADESTTPKVQIPGAQGFELPTFGTQKISDVSPSFFGLSPLFPQFTSAFHPD